MKDPNDKQTLEMNWRHFEDGEPCDYEHCHNYSPSCPVCKRTRAKGKVIVVEPRSPEENED